MQLKFRVQQTSDGALTPAHADPHAAIRQSQFRRTFGWAPSPAPTAHVSRDNKKKRI